MDPLPNHCASGGRDEEPELEDPDVWMLPNLKLLNMLIPRYHPRGFLVQTTIADLEFLGSDRASPD